MSKEWRCLALLAAVLTALTAVLPVLAAEPERTLAPGQEDVWQPPAPDLYAVAARGDRVWAVGYWGSVLFSEDAGSTWTTLQTPSHATLYGVSFADDRHGWAVGQGGAVLRTTDGGASWRLQQVGLEDDAGSARALDSHLFAVAALSPRRAWAVGDLGVVLRTEDGERWERVAMPFLDDGQVQDRIFNAVRFIDPEHGWIVGEFGTTLRTTDGGRTWTGTRAFVDAVEDLYLFDVSAVDALRAAAVGLSGSVVVTEDGGATWRGLGVGTSAGLFGVAWAEERATVVGDRGEIYTRADRGDTWVAAERPRLFNWLQAAARVDGGRLFAVGEKGLILGSEDGGASWRQLSGRAPPPLSAVSIPDPAPRPAPGVQERAVPLLGESAP